MYVLLRGQVTVYHNDDAAGARGSGDAESGKEADADVVVSTESGDEQRQQLGVFVVTISGKACSVFYSARNSIECSTAQRYWRTRRCKNVFYVFFYFGYVIYVF